MSEYDLWTTTYHVTIHKNIVENKSVDKIRIKEVCHNPCRNNIIEKNLCVQRIRLILLSINSIKYH